MENKIIRNKKNTKKNLKKLLKSENTFSSSAVSEILESCNSSKAVGNDTLTEFNITLNPMLNRGMKDFIENFDFNVLETEEEESSNVSFHLSRMMFRCGFIIHANSSGSTYLRVIT